MRRHHAIEKEFILNNQFSYFICKELKNLAQFRAASLARLFQNGCEPAYISRYRPEVHGGASPEVIRKAQEVYFNVLELNEKVLGAIGIIIPGIVGRSEKLAVENRLRSCECIEEVNEIKREFAPDSIKSRAQLAREYGLVKPSEDILNGLYIDTKCLLSGNLPTIAKVEEYLKICLADLINKDPDVKKKALEIGSMETSCPLRVTSSIPKDADFERLKETKPYKEHQHIIGRTWDFYSIEEHTISKLIRASEEKVLVWGVELISIDAEKLHPYLGKEVNSGMTAFFRKAFGYSINRYFIPMVERIAKKHLKSLAEDRGIQVFGKNVEELLSTEGVREKYVIALDPGSFIKAALLDIEGNEMDTADFWMNPDNSFDEDGVKILKDWSHRTQQKDLIIAVGNGSYSHEVQVAVSKVIYTDGWCRRIDTCIAVVPEQGASKYSCTEAAREEFGEEADIKHISAISIGRRLIDPLAEYVKIPPQHLGKGQYQHSIKEELLNKKMVAVVRDKVSAIGADLNLASKQLLQNICGLDEEKAASIISYRKTHGRFWSRDELKKVDGIDEKTFQQCAGFLTVSKEENDDLWCPLDKTRVHPDNYEVALKLLNRLHISIDDIINGIGKLNIGLSNEEKMIVELIQLKIDMKPPPEMVKEVLEFRRIHEGQKRPGTVANVTDIGVFVNIGVGRDGLIMMSHYYKEDPIMETRCQKRRRDERIGVPSVGERVEVIVERIRNDGKIDLKPVGESAKKIKLD